MWSILRLVNENLLAHVDGRIGHQGLFQQIQGRHLESRNSPETSPGFAQPLSADFGVGLAILRKRNIVQNG